jgi:tight adherence protein B
MSGSLLGGTVAAGLAGVAGALGIAAGRAHGALPLDHSSHEPGRRISRRSSVTAAVGLAALVVAGPFMAVLAVACSVGAAWVGKIRQRARRQVLMGEQLIDAVAGLGAALRAGLSLERALRFAAEEAEPPLSDSLAALITDIDLGEPMDHALERWALADGTADARLLAGVLRLDRRSGGDLPRILDQVASTLRERREAEGEVRALTAQARLSGLILGLLPVGFFLFLLITSTKDVTAALHTPIGIGAVFLGSVLEVVAFMWIRHLLEVR